MVKYIKSKIGIIFFITIHFSLLTALSVILLGKPVGLETRNINLFFSPLPLVFDHKHFFTKVNLRIKYSNDKQENIFLNKDIVDQVDGPDNRKLHFVRLLMFSKFYPEAWVRANMKYFFCNKNKLSFIKDKVSSVDTVINYKNTIQSLRATCN